MVGFDKGPFPNTLVPNTVVVMFAEAGQSDDDRTSNRWLQIPFTHELAGMVIELQLLPEVELE